MSTDTATAPRRRPRDRKQQILAVAAARFWAEGYHRVGMADIAAALDIAPSALYRHFQGKQELLLAILDEHLTRIEALRDDPRGMITGLAGLTLERREFGLLWERESGHLPDEVRRAMRHRLRALAAVLRAESPDPGTADVRAWAAMSVLDSPSHHRVDIEPERFSALLSTAARAVLDVPVPQVRAEPAALPPRRTLAPASRREALLAAAIALFGERGYPSVSLTDIGAAAGIAGPSVYRHFATKTDLLLAALHRGNECLWLGLHSALARAQDPAEALTGIVAHYTGFAAENPELVSTLVSEVVHLPDDGREALRRSQRDYVAEWVALLTADRPRLPTGEALVLIHAALAVVNSLTRIPHVAAQPGASATIAHLARTVLAGT
jgi:AcrR family transcriptional regulator